MPIDDGFTSERQRIFQTAAGLKIDNPNSESLITELVKTTPLTDVARLTDAGLRVRMRDVAAALDMTVPAPQAAEYKAPPTAFLNPVARLQALYASQRVELDPQEAELLRLRNESKVRKLSSLEKSTVARLEWAL